MIELIPKIIGYSFFKKFGSPKILPVFLTLSVNDWCNSRCKTCNIWRNNPEEKTKEELILEEYKKILENYGKVYWITITGGEPFLRKDLVKIAQTAYEKTNLKFLTIATNATMTKKIISDVKQILKSCKNLNLIINISFDGIGAKHDDIRGLEGNFNKVLKTFNLLKKINNPRLIVGINTVVSTYNIKNFFETYEYIENILKPDSFIMEIAERRSKLFNINLKITPKYIDYKKILEFLISEIEQMNFVRSKTSKIIRNLRTEFYKFLLSREPIENFEGISSAYIMSNGEVWLSYSKRYVVGNLRKVNYDLKKLWFNEKAENFRKMMNNGKYNNFLVNAFYVNFICNPKNYFRPMHALRMFELIRYNTKD
jgi:MoaA/NifB/PqqE/SkfB family radical SAM enzyme